MSKFYFLMLIIISFTGLTLTGCVGGGPQRAVNYLDEQGSIEEENQHFPKVYLVEQRNPEPFLLQAEENNYIGGTFWIEIQFAEEIREHSFWEELGIEGAEVLEKAYHKDNIFRFLLKPQLKEIDISLSEVMTADGDSFEADLHFTLHWEDPPTVTISHAGSPHLDTSAPQFMTQLVAARGPRYRGTLGPGEQVFSFQFSKAMDKETVEEALTESLPEGLSTDFIWEERNLLTFKVDDLQVGQEYIINTNGAQDERGMVLAGQPMLSLLVVNPTIIYSAEDEEQHEIALEGHLFDQGYISPQGNKILLKQFLAGEGDLAPTLCWVYDLKKDTLFPAAPPRLLAGSPNPWFPHENTLLLPHIRGITISHLAGNSFTHRELVEMEEEEFLLGAALSLDGSKLAYVYGSHNDWLNLEVIAFDEQGQEHEPGTWKSISNIIRKASVDGVSLAVELSWAPDNKHLAVSEFAGDDWQVSIINLETEEKTILQPSVRAPSWSPAGDFIFLEGSWEHPSIIVDPQGEKLFEFPGGNYLGPRWNQEGKKLLISDYTDVRNPQTLVLEIKEEGKIHLREADRGGALGWLPGGNKYYYFRSPYIDLYRS